MSTENQTTDDLPTWRSTGVGYSGENPLGPPTLREAECITKDALVTVRVRLQHCRAFIHATVTWGAHGVGRDGGERSTRSVQERTWDLPPRDGWGSTMDEAKCIALAWASTVDRSRSALSEVQPYAGLTLSLMKGMASPFKGRV